MKRIYEKPIMNVQHFAANEYVAACGYEFDCNATVNNLGTGGLLFRDVDKDGILDDGDYVVNRMGENGFNLYKPCNAKHSYDGGECMKGFLVNQSDFNNAKGPWWGWQDEETKRRDFRWERLTNARPVYIWDATFSPTQKGWHASTKAPYKNHS